MAPVAISSSPAVPAGITATKAALAATGASTPYSTTSTAVSEAGDKTIPGSPKSDKDVATIADGKAPLIPGEDGYFEALIESHSPLPTTAPGATVFGSALEVLEALAVQNSSSVWVYDDAVQIGFGARLAAWDADEVDGAAGKIHPVETREGAGLEVAGYAKKAPAGKISVFASAMTLPYLASNLASIDGDVVIHVAATTTSADLELGDALAERGVLKALTQLPEEWDVVFSAGGVDVVATAAHVYGAKGKVINVIESTYSARETTSFKFPAAGAYDEFVVAGGDSPDVFLAVASHAASTINAPKVVLNTLAPTPEKLAAALSSKNTITVTGPSHADAEALKAVVLATLYSAPASSSAKLPAIKVAVTPKAAPVEEDAKIVSFFTAPTAPLPQLVGQLFLSSPALNTTLAQYGSATVAGTKSVLAISQGAAVPVSPYSQSDLIWVNDSAVFKGTDVLATAKEGATLVLELPWTEDDLQSKLSAAEIKTIQDKNIRVFLFDLDPACSLNPIREQAGFLLLYTGKQRLPRPMWNVLDKFHNGQLGRDQVEDAQASLFEIPRNTLQKLEVDPEKLAKKTKAAWTWDAIAGDVVGLDAAPAPLFSSWELAARHLLFREAYAVPDAKTVDSDEAVPGVSSLTPELSEETFLVTVSENRRLTPTTYDRNIFHLELDTKGTGLKYEIGEAIGIHGWNDASEVLEFCKWYGLDPEALVAVPNPQKEGTQTTRTVFQLLQQNLDLFGQPGKSFYGDLSKLAADRTEAMKLKFISVPEGAELFVRKSEAETVNFADILREFPSAHPTVEQLIELVPEIKPRHYSIASAQAVVGDKVELLIVTVDWVDSQGRTRYGQCTRYLNELTVGDKVTVSIKPSVMKLPPLDSQPIIMAGLGTGAAPFKAYMMYRAWQKSQGLSPAKVSYYFGARHRSEEYLYGEDIEAFYAAGVIDNLGLAFSRDQKHKVYIQHKIKEDAQALAKMLLAHGDDAGYFYLCGPTWPVPDVFNALCEALVDEGNMSREAAEKYLEDLKEDERYVLEVY